MLPRAEDGPGGTPAEENESMIAKDASGRERAQAAALRFPPVIAILVLQLVFFPVPTGVWLRGAIVGGLPALIAPGRAPTGRAHGVVSFALPAPGLVPMVHEGK